MTNDNGIPLPSHGIQQAPGDVERINELAQNLEMLLGGIDEAQDLPPVLELIEQSSRTFAELGAILLTKQDRKQMEAVISSLTLLIARMRKLTA